MLWGPSRTGKTTWARSLGSHIYYGSLFSGGEALARHDEADYAVFDDMRGGLKFFPAYKDWLGAQAYPTVKALYKEPRTIKWGKPSVWISNSDPREAEGADVDWLNANCFFCYVHSPIVTFHANTD